MMRAIVGAVVLVIVGVPMLLVNLSALGMQDSWEQVMGGERTVPTSVASAGRAVNDWFADAREGQIASALFDPVTITDHRYVQMKRSGLTVSDVLAPGEAAPAPEYAHLWIAARGLALAQAEGCPMLLETIATRCSAGRLDVKPRDDGTFHLEARLGYAPADAPGPVPAQGRGVELRDLRLRLPESGGLRLTGDNAPDVQRQLVLAAQEACRSLKAEQGTCVIRSLQFVERQRGATGEMSASVTLSWLASEGDGRQASLTVPDRVREAALDGADDATPPVTEAAAAGGIFATLKGLLGGGGGTARSGSGEAPRVLQGGAARHTGNTIAVSR